MRVGGVSVVDGALVQSFSSPESGGLWILDPATLKPTGKAQRDPGGSVVAPPEASVPESDFPGMRVQWRSDSGEPSGTKDWFMLRWETLGPNRDRPRDEPWPAPGMLRVYRMGRIEQAG